MKLKKSGYYVANGSDSIAYSRDISRCMQYANRKIKKWGMRAGWFALYAATECEQAKGAIIPKSNAAPILLYREGKWTPNQQYTH